MILTRLVAIAALLTLTSIAASADEEKSKIKHAGNAKVVDEYIVVLEDDVPAEQVAEVAGKLATAHDAKLLKVWTHALKGFFVEMKESHADALSRKKEVKYVEENAAWSLSASQQTNVNPVTCDPISGTCSTVTDNRLWHLDRADQNYADPTLSYAYSCTDGTGVTVYVVDTGVNKFHNEFAPGGARVQPGFNASGDLMPPDDPCMGFALPPSGDFWYIEGSQYTAELQRPGHGTAVASALGGRRVGIAKNVNIVPIKVSRCDKFSARARRPSQSYQTNETMWRTTDGGSPVAYYRALNSGVTASTGMFDPPPGSTSWPTSCPTTPCPTIQDNEVTWQVIRNSDIQNVGTTQMIIDGLNWILSPSNPGPKSYAVTTLSTFLTMNSTDLGAAEDVIRSLLANNITVIASANNQNGNACDTSPARLSQNNLDVPERGDVITAGGSMLINRPWSVDISDAPAGAFEADGLKPAGGTMGVEPAFDATKGVRDGRWICGPGDSDMCHNATPTSTVAPTSPDYAPFNGGSNAGPCVTLFVPAKNLFLASVGAADHYRDARLRSELASGTSWSAPIVAGFAARVLQSNPTFTPTQVRTTLLDNSAAVLDAATLNTFDHNGVEITGTPNKLLRLGDVNIIGHPQSTPAALSGTTPLSVDAAGTSTLSYQWYEVNSTFDYATFKRGAHPPNSSIAIAGANSATYQAPASGVRKAYWARVSNSCGSADSDIAVVVPRPGPPSNVLAEASGTIVSISWTAGSGAEKYDIQRKVAGQAWTRAGLVNSTVLTFNDTPTAPGGMVVYRVLSVAGEAYLPPENVATSAPSNNDIANVNSSTYEVLATPPNYTQIKAQHSIELRQAVNALCDAVGAPQQYAAADVLLSALQGKVVEASDFTTLMTRINNIRTNPLIALAAATFSEVPVPGLTITRAHLQSLRDALK